MPPPTLLAKTTVVIQPWMNDYEKNAATTSLAKDYILSWFAARIPTRRGGLTTIPATSISDRIMVLRSGTGSGKSTTLAPELYIKFYQATLKNIAVTQPRVLTATSIPTEITKVYPSIKLGKNIGYQTGSYTLKPTKGIVFMTVGVLSQQLKVMSDEDFMKKYAFIIIDECHDRSLDMDLALSLIKGVLSRNFKSTECPFLILTSATFDVAKYADYFGVNHRNIIDVVGLNFPISTKFLDVSTPNFVAKAAELALSLHATNTADYTATNRFRDILIFVSGATPISDIRKLLDAANSAHAADNFFVVIELTGASFQSGSIDYQNVFKPLSSITVKIANKIVTPLRRIIISTNVAETGVTIDTLKYIIDTGYVNEAIFNPVYGAASLLSKNVTKASATQRKGRVGRRAPGEWHPLYTEADYNLLPADNNPTLFTADISPAILGLLIKQVHPNWDGIVSPTLMATGRFDPANIDLLDYPTVDGLAHALDKLFLLGFVGGDLDPTLMGLAAAKFMKVDLELIRMILAGYQTGCSVLDLVTIAAFMSLMKSDYLDKNSKTKYNYRDVFANAEGAPINDKEYVYYSKLFVSDDFIECLFIWDGFTAAINASRLALSIAPAKEWCAANGLVYGGLLQVVEARDAIILQMVQSVGLDPFHNGMGLPRGEYSLPRLLRVDMYTALDEIRKLKQSIYEGFRLQAATWDDARLIYRLDMSGQKIKVKSDVIQPLPPHPALLQTRPKKIVVRGVAMRSIFNTPIYGFEGDRVCSLDGFVDVDETFATS